VSGRLELLTWPAVQAAVDARATVILPLGAIEQHGPNLPIDTDSFLAHELALAASESRPDVFVAPPLSYGSRSRPQMGGGERFPGTLSLSGHTYIDVVRDTLAALLRTGFRRLLVYSWHMENRGFTYEAAYLASETCPDAKTVVVEEPFDSLSDPTMGKMFPAGFPGWPSEHAGVLETSLMLLLRPPHTGSEPAADRQAVRAYEVLPQPALGPDASGVLWDAAGSTAENGERAFAEIVGKLQQILTDEFPEVT
jgi:creatinine amidohydrolase